MTGGCSSVGDADTQLSVPTQTSGLEKKRAKSNDPGWKYAFWPNPNDKNKVKCELCGLISNGGIKRQKEHLIGGFSDIQKCPKSTPEIAAEMLAWLNKNRKKRPNPNTPIREEEEFDEEEPVDPTRSTIGGTRGSSSSDAHILSSKKTLVKGPMDAFRRMSAEEYVDARRSGQKFQPTIDSKLKKEEKENVDKSVATWFYEGGVPFNAARLKSFEIMFENVGRFGSGYKPPSYHQLRVPLLAKMVEETTELQKKYEKCWKIYGCTIMCDGWTDRKQRHLINFLVNCPIGTFFVESFNASGEKEDANLLFNLIDKMVDKIGEENVIQVVTDNASANVAAGKRLMEKRPKLFWTPCAAHCLDLMLEDICKMKVFKSTIAKAKKLTNYCYTHTRLLDYLRKETNGRELVRCGVTRFATAFLTLDRLNEDSIKNAIRNLFVSQAWYESAWSKTSAGQNVAKIVYDTKFWLKVCDVLRASQPLLQVLRLVDGDEKPAMGYLYAAMEYAKEQIASNFGHKKKNYEKIVEKIEKRWDEQMSRPLHLAGFFLNPKFFYETKAKEPLSSGKFLQAFYTCLDRMFSSSDVELVDKIHDQVEMYIHARGTFGKDWAVRARDRKLPNDWWEAYGIETPELQQVACKILGLCCSSSGCERNWSTFEFIHTKKRNRLEHKRLNDLVFVQYNRRLHERFTQRSNASFDPISFDDLDWGSEWLTPNGEDLVHPGDDITWQVVQDAMGVCERRLQRKNNKGKGKASSSRAPPQESSSSSSSSSSSNGEEDEDIEMGRDEETDDDVDAPFGDDDHSVERNE